MIQKAAQAVFGPGTLELECRAGAGCYDVGAELPPCGEVRRDRGMGGDQYVVYVDVQHVALERSIRASGKGVRQPVRLARRGEDRLLHRAVAEGVQLDKAIAVIRESDETVRLHLESTARGLLPSDDHGREYCIVGTRGVFEAPVDYQVTRHGCARGISGYRDRAGE